MPPLERERERMEHNFSPIEERKEKLQCRCKPPSSSAAVLRGHPYITFYILYQPHTTPYLSFSIIPAWVNPSPLYMNVIHGWPLIIRVCHMGSVGLSATPQAPTSQQLARVGGGSMCRKKKSIKKFKLQTEQNVCNCLDKSYY